MGTDRRNDCHASQSEPCAFCKDELTHDGCPCVGCHGIFVEPGCFSCGGPFHAATGDVDPATGVQRCGACMKHFYSWFRRHQHVRMGKHRFYDHAMTSVRAVSGSISSQAVVL